MVQDLPFFPMALLTIAFFVMSRVRVLNSTPVAIFPFTPPPNSPFLRLIVT